jgi:hypothetical protein
MRRAGAGARDRVRRLPVWEVFSVRDFGSGFASGYWTMASSSLAMAIGGVLASVARS